MATAQKRKPSIKQRRAAKIAVGNGGNITQAMIQAGYSPATANTPQKLTETIGWNQLMEKYLSEESLAEHHEGLLKASHLVNIPFPDGPEHAEIVISPDGAKTLPSLSDDEIKKMFADAGSKVSRIVRTSSGRSVYFWAPDNRARKDALDMAYKLRGSYAAEKHTTTNLNLNVAIEADAEAILTRAEDDLVARMKGHASHPPAGGNQVNPVLPVQPPDKK